MEPRPTQIHEELPTSSHNIIIIRTRVARRWESWARANQLTEPAPKQQSSTSLVNLELYAAYVLLIHYIIIHFSSDPLPY